MAMYKAAQFLGNDMNDGLVVALPIESAPKEEDDSVVVLQEPVSEEMVELNPSDQALEISFKLPLLPGAPDDVIELSGDNLEVGSDNEDKDDKGKDKSKVADQPKDLNWIKSYLDNIPKHKGETIGLERAKSYLNRASNILSKMLQEDYDGKIDIAQAESARVEIENGIERLDKELQRRKKKASVNNGLTKEGQKLPAVGGIIVTVPILISRIARVCINGSISGGKDIEDLFHRQAKKWNLSDREKVEVIQLISDMGYHVGNLDRGFMSDDKEKYERSSTNNYDNPANYSS